MEEEWLVYLRENNPELYKQAGQSLNWMVKWRDEKINDLQNKFEQAKTKQCGKCNDLSKELTTMTSLAQFRFRRLEELATEKKQLQAENQRLTKELSVKGEYGYSQEVVDSLQKEISGLRVFKQNIDEQLNSGDGAYRP